MSAHDRGHVERVTRLARYIATREGADVGVVTAAAELHDLARGEPDHARKSAERARKILRARGRPEEFIEQVVHCIEAHSFSKGVEPRTLEAKVLSDADKLDAMGAIGVARAFLYSGEIGRSLEETLRHFEEKLLALRDSLHTETARELARERHRFLEEFYRRLREELGGITRST
ncbi:MAG: HD domain-containing protein [Caldiserica bacterium]|nr:HD domain-containing protein [Caldisericota bacterium]